MNTVLHLRIVGVLLLLLAVANLFFPRRFRWKEELARVSLFTRQVFFVHAGFIVLTLLMFGGLALGFAGELVEPGPLARAILIGLTAFWAARLFAQFFVYDSALWKDNRFNTVVHVVCSTLWLYFTIVFASALLGQVRG